MEIVLAVIVGTAVIFFGALISAGNERQRKAIDGLREQVVLWAMKDLQIKREKLTRDIRVDDPLAWLNKVVARVSGCDLKLQVIEASENPRVLTCTMGDGNGRILFTPLAPGDIRTMKRAKHNRLSQYADRNPLLSLPRNVTAFECSVLNSGMLFDLELPFAWKGLTGHTIDEVSIMWMYLI